MTSHVAPASVERQTSYEVTGVPPLVKGEPHEMYADVPEMKPVRDVGADGAEKASGVIVTTLEAALFPIAFTASTRNWWLVPPVKPVINVLRVNTDKSGRRVHVAPLSTEYSTR